MSLETDLTALLQGLCPRVFPDFAPAETVRPYLVWQQVGGPSESYVDNTVPSNRMARLQLSVWADTRLAASALALQVEASMITASVFQARPLGAFSTTFDEDLALRGTLQDFMISAGR
jgi:hypothetical protein